MLKTNSLAWIIIGLFATIVSFISSFFLFSLGLILIEFLVYPLALSITALFTALTAVFLSNLLLDKGQHTPPRPVVMACEGTAVALAILLIILTVAKLLSVPGIFIVIPATLLLTSTALIAAKRHRSDQPVATNERKQVMLWIAIAIVAVPLVIFIASLFGWAGA
jgi:hypothetical protein